MEVGSWIQATTLVVGWKYYELIWQLLVATGVVFLPIVGLLISTFVEARRKASVGHVGTDTVLANFEMKLFVLFIVFFMCSMPNSLTVTAGNDVTLFTPGNNLYVDDPPASETVNVCQMQNTTATTNQPVAAASDMCGDTVRMPIWWWLTQNISQGVTMAVIREASTQNNNLHRALIKFKHMAKINDPVSRDLLAILQRDCMGPARAMYLARDTQGANEPNTQGIEIDWVGAQELQSFYGLLPTSEAVRGMLVDPDLQNEVDTAYGGDPISKQTCASVWTTFSDRVWGEIQEDAGFVTRVLNAAGVANVQDDAVEEYVRSTTIGQASTTETLNKLRNGEDGIIEKTFGIFTSGFAIFEMTKAVIKTNMYVDVLIVALPMLQAYLLMFIIMALPFGFLFSRYEFQFILRATALVFSISFWPAIWAVVAWIDNELAAQLYPTLDTMATLASYVTNAGTMADLNDSLTNIITRLSHNLVTLSLYVVGPIAFSWVMSSAGFGEGQSAAIGAAGSVGAATGATGAAAGKGAARAFGRRAIGTRGNQTGQS